MGLRVWAAIGAAFLALFGLIAYGGLQLELSEQRAAAAEREVAQVNALNTAQAQVLADKAWLQEELGRIGAGTRLTQQAIDAQSVTLRQGIQELKRNDREVSDYLRGRVPVALGVRYARTESTDPVAYRADTAKAVRADTVPAPGASSPGD